MTDDMLIPASIIAILTGGIALGFLSNYLGKFVSCRVDTDKLRLERRKAGAKKE